MDQVPVLGFLGPIILFSESNLHLLLWEADQFCQTIIFWDDRCFWERVLKLSELHCWQVVRYYYVIWNWMWVHVLKACYPLKSIFWTSNGTSMSNLKIWRKLPFGLPALCPLRNIVHRWTCEQSDRSRQEADLAPHPGTSSAVLGFSLGGGIHESGKGLNSINFQFSRGCDWPGPSCRIVWT